MTGCDAIQLARECVALKRANPDLFLTLNWKGRESDGMLLYCCAQFVQRDDLEAPLTDRLQFRSQFEGPKEMPGAIRQLLQFEPAKTDRTWRVTLDQLFGSQSYRSVRVRGYPQRVFYLSAGRVHTVVDGRVVTVVNVTLEGSLVPPTINSVTLLTVETRASGEKVFDFYKESCTKVQLSPSLMWAR